MPDTNSLDDVLPLCRSPRTGAQLQREGGHLVSIADSEDRYPVVEGIPVLINEDESLFSVDQFEQKTETTVPETSRLVQRVARLLPSLNLNVRAEDNFQRFVDELPSPARVLVVGGRTRGEGSDVLYESPSIKIFSTDVAFGPETDLICDAHDLPFQDGAFDGVVAQAVLEHVADPQRCVGEMHRVLAPNGIVHAETPFLQAMHMKPYDFTRFTMVGYRRLFSSFDVVGIGPTCGPGMALAWAYRGFLRSFGRSAATQRALAAIAHLTAFPLKYLDHWLIDRPGARDAASGYYFTGRKRQTPLSDEDVISWFHSL
ncbi:class I SAM-dependent methyltransferase [Longibacter salinarum]|uniref:class I SAM-dependent methyltransferase n=1 Tax=Longibacter salinarum TaxID=1850348 RepID=UPI0015CF1AD0|nr:class I SAM-dependent methyltransferase [Longibacter salinarum]